MPKKKIIEREERVCSFCGEWIEDPNKIQSTIDNELICLDCSEFFNTKLERRVHYIWAISSALYRVEKLINEYQSRVIEMEQKEERQMPYCTHELSNDTREKRIKSLNEFLTQYYSIHKWLKQMYKIVKHKDMELSAEEIVSYLKSR